MDRLLTAEEIGECLGMKTQWVWAQARAGRIPHVGLGRYRRFRESVVEAWLRNLEADSAAPATSTAPAPSRFAGTPRASDVVQLGGRLRQAAGSERDVPLLSSRVARAIRETALLVCLFAHGSFHDPPRSPGLGRAR
jgi:excisionase family DNA binding protein